MFYSKFFLFVTTIIVGMCSCSDEIQYDKSIIIRNTQANDSVYVSFKIKNRSNNLISLVIYPECDCTLVNPEEISIEAHSNETVDVSFVANTPFYYERWVFLQRMGSDMLDTIVIKGNISK